MGTFKFYVPGDRAGSLLKGQYGCSEECKDPPAWLLASEIYIRTSMTSALLTSEMQSRPLMATSQRRPSELAWIFNHH